MFLDIKLGKYTLLYVITYDSVYFNNIVVNAYNFSEAEKVLLLIG